MADEAKIHVGDVGTELVVVFKDEEGTVIDVSAADDIFLYLTDPDGVIVEVEGVHDTDGVNGKVKYVTEAGDLMSDGSWSIQGWASVGGDEFSALDQPFEVFPARRYPDGDDR